MTEISFHFGVIMSRRQRLTTKFFNNFSYICTKRCRSTTYVVCSQKDSRDCPATGKIINRQLTLLTEHNHRADPLAEQVYLFEKALHEEVIRNLQKSLKAIYEEISITYPQAAVRKTWLKMQSRMQQWRRQTRPARPSSLVHYIQILSEPQWSFYTTNTNNNGQLLVHTVRASDQSYITIFANQQLPSSINVTELFMDATFTIVPKQPKVLQLFTVLGLINDTAIPIIWCLMERKSIAAYLTLLRHFSNILTPQINPTIITSDFKAALASAINTAYPNALHKRCYFHYCQALIRKLKKMRMLNLIKNWRMGQIIVKKLFALPLLPPQNIYPAFNWIINNTPDIIKSVMHRFFSYYQRQWIQRTRPECFSVYGMTHRTNNFCEAYNRTLNARFGVHPSIWVFTDTLNCLQQNSLIEYTALMSGNPIRRATRNQQVMHGETLQKIWNFNNDHILNTRIFLACASNALQAFTREIIDENSELAGIAIDHGNYLESHDLQNLQQLDVFEEIDINTAVFLIVEDN